MIFKFPFFKETVSICALAVTIFFWFPALANQDCLKTRAAFDIGSGTTKLKVARVDTCLMVIVDVLASLDQPVGYSDDLKGKTDQNRRFSDDIQKIGLQVIEDLLATAAKHKPDELRGAATQAFREALNGPAFASLIQSKFGIKTKIISQKEEGEFGFYGAVAQSQLPTQNLVVWDIGGGSMQFSMQSETKNSQGRQEVVVCRGGTASVPFKEHLIRALQKKDPAIKKSPNPIGKIHLLALDYARNTAKTNVDSACAERVRKQKTVVYGIGGVHYFSIRSRLTDKLKGSYGEQNLLAAYTPLLSKTDDDLGGGQFVATDVSNLILVRGYMVGLGIRQVHPVNVTNSDALLVVESW